MIQFLQLKILILSFLVVNINNVFDFHHSMIAYSTVSNSGIAACTTGMSNWQFTSCIWPLWLPVVTWQFGGRWSSIVVIVNKNEWSWNFSSPICLHSLDRENLPFCVNLNKVIKWFVIFPRGIFVFANWKPYHMCVSFVKIYLAFAKSTCIILHTIGTLLRMCNVYNKMWN